MTINWKFILKYPRFITLLRLLYNVFFCIVYFCGNKTPKTCVHVFDNKLHVCNYFAANFSYLFQFGDSVQWYNQKMSTFRPMLATVQCTKFKTQSVLIINNLYTKLVYGMTRSKTSTESLLQLSQLMLGFCFTKNKCGWQTLQIKRKRGIKLMRNSSAVFTFWLPNL